MMCARDHGQGLLEPNHILRVPKYPIKPHIFLYNIQSTDRMYRDWIADMLRKSVVHLDNSSIGANGEIFDIGVVLSRGRNAPLQEDNDRDIGFGPRWMTNPEK